MLEVLINICQFVLLTIYYSGGQTKENQVDGRRDMRMGSCWGNLKLRYYLRELTVMG
jgi:hypothetical protein